MERAQFLPGARWFGPARCKEKTFREKKRTAKDYSTRTGEWMKGKEREARKKRLFPHLAWKAFVADKGGGKERSNT